LAKVLAALDKSVAWFNDASHREESIDILAKEMRAKREPIARSYDYLRKIDYFAPSNAVSRAKLRSLINEMKSLGDLKQDIAPETFVLSGLARLVD
jgi:ABC-type nitrate/sulfonate/bicarbonate transport system substrate-binding protein